MRLDFTKIKILQDSYVFLLNNEFLSDIKFKFNDGRIIFAHSFVLCCRSDEFCDTFEATVGVSKLIEVKDFTYEEYYEFLKYLYTDECELDGSNETSLIRLSKRHELEVLETRCTDHMVKDMSVDNVCTILTISIEHELEDLKKKTTEFIAENYLASLNTESFLKIQDTALKAILELNPVSDIDEFKIFQAVIEWAEQACLNDGIEPNGTQKRTKLGDILKLLRFGAMTAAEFTTCTDLEPDLLKNYEVISIFKNLASGKENPFGFVNKKRLQLDLKETDNVVLYGRHLNNSRWSDIRSDDDIELNDFKMEFSVSHPILIEEAKWYFNNIMMIRLIENSKTIYEGHDLSDFIISKQLLQANTRYTFYVTYSYKRTDFYITGDLKFKSASGKCEFTIYKGSFGILFNLSFKV